MSQSENIILTNTDYQNILALLERIESRESELLEEELGRAAIVADDNLPSNIVAMNSIVEFEDLENGRKMVVTLVYPHEADMELNKISILTPIGSALIGLKVGQTIKWPMPSQKVKHLRVSLVRR